MLENKGRPIEQRRLPEQKSAWRAALFASLALHGGLYIGIKREQVMDYAKTVMAGAQLGFDKAGDFLQPGNLKLVVQSIERSTEEGEQIENLQTFYTVADQIKNEFSNEELALVEQNVQVELTEAQRLQTTGANQQVVVDYLLSREGEYEESIVCQDPGSIPDTQSA